MEAKEASIKQENRIARMFGGKRTPQSGGGKFVLGDVISDEFLVECKTTITERETYPVRKEVLRKADEQRKEMGKEFYALAFTFGTDEDFFVLDRRTMRYLLSCMEELRDTQR